MIYFSDTYLGFSDLDITNDKKVNQYKTDFYYASHSTFCTSISFPLFLFLIAIFKTLSELNGRVCFLVFDEVFGSQDEGRRFEIMDAFPTIKEQYRQIFLISYENEIKEIFERVVEL